MTQLRLQKQLLEWREVDDEVIALEQKQSVYLGANPAGTLLWRALDVGTTEPELATLLVDEYGISTEQAEADVAVFLTDLDQRGLLESR
jgi:hypothetical protein